MKGEPLRKCENCGQELLDHEPGPLCTWCKKRWAQERKG